MKIRVLIVDDEPLARRRLRTLLRDQPGVEVVGECRDGREAVEAIRKSAPDLVFLDVQMPEINGFDVLEAIGPAHMPAVIFVTAHDQHAVRAFSVNALDYLLKPFDQRRFGDALDRARAHLASEPRGELNRRLLALLGELHAGRKYLDRIVVRSGGRISFLRAGEIDWVGAAGNYTELHVGRESHLLRETMAFLEEQFDPQKFLRIHRSTIVNLERIREMQPSIHGDYVLELRDGTRLTLSRNYRGRLEERLGRLR